MSLNRLIAMQKAAKENQIGSTTTPPPVNAAKPESKPSPQPPVVSTPAPNPKRLPFGNLGKKPSAAPVPTPKPAPSEPKESLSLDNLGSFDLSEVGDSDAGEVPDEWEGFHDEIEATAPDRALPEDMTPEMLGFVESLDTIYQILNDPEMFGQQVRQIMMELQENPEYEQLISDTDVHVMIRAMRNTMGLARVKKQAKQRKTGSTASKTRAPSRKQALMDKALAISVGIPGLGDLD